MLMGEEDVVPRPRGPVPVVCGALLSCLAVLVVWMWDSTLVKERFAFILLSLIVGEILHSLCLLVEEWLFHSRQRYGGSVKRILQACFSTRTLGGVCVLTLVLLLGCDVPQQGLLFILTSTFYLFLKTLGVLGPSPVEVSEVCESRKMNVAHGLAWSFYLGYLKLVLPELQEKIQKHYNDTKEVLSSPRLHILLPLNAGVRSKLEDEDGIVRFHKNLPEYQINRAGVRGRVYKHSIYTVTGHNNQVYACVVEYATPLQTLYEMSQDSTAGFGERDRTQQVLLFYKTLSHILESSLECRDRYRLILLDDLQAGDRHYLSKEIIKHLQQQEQEIPMDLSLNLNHPVVEEGKIRTQYENHHEEPPSSIPTLMFSVPRPLRSGPEENTDYTHYQKRQK